MKHFFIPGNHPDLSLNELKSVCKVAFKGTPFTINSKSRNYFFLRADVEPQLIDAVFKRLGGFTKYGLVLEDQDDFLKTYAQQLDSIEFGISLYPYESSSSELADHLVSLSNQIKAFYKSHDMRVRYIRNDTGLELSTGQILQNEILQKGFDLNIFEYKDTYLAGQTLGVQDIEEFTKNDRLRPVIDKDMGMLPPKLARIMVNLAQLEQGEILWDPFCGSGTILVEAALLGYNVLGSDIDAEAVEAAQQNIEWAIDEYELPETKYRTFQWDVTKYDSKLRSTLRETEIGAVVFEPFMGPPQRRQMHPSKAEKLLMKVSKLYKPLFEFLENINQDKLKVVAVLPEYKTHQGWVGVRYSHFMSKRWDIINNKISEKDLHWSRSNSIIRRKIMILELNR